MPDVLGFNPNRKLEFAPNRELEFRPNRPLEFDPRRPLSFNAGRDLGFGRRGVVFRGYVCPICGALTNETAARCEECGATFESTPKQVGPTPPRAGAAPIRPAAPAPSRTAPPAPTPPTTTATAAKASRGTSRSCPFCGARLWEGDAFCWNCGARMSRGAVTPGIPRSRR